MRIPIVFATDENYIFYTCVAITSLAKNAACDTEYDISILIGEGFPDKSLLDDVGRRYSNITLRFIKMNSESFRQVTINNNHVTKAAFYRLVLSDLLDDVKCIYLDSDIIVTEDLQPLFSVNMEEYYIAGCRDIWIDMMTEEKREERRIRTRLQSMDEYINSGVLVMNLRKIREDGIDKMFVQQLSTDYPFEDQDILNVCCYGRIRHLPAKWNIFTLFMGKLNEMRGNGIAEPVLDAFRKKQGIIHYATPFIRPWKNTCYWANQMWWDVAAEWAEDSCYQELYIKVGKHDAEQRFEFWLEKCKEYQKIVIVGFTVYGKNICDWLLNNGFGEKLWFCDSDTEKQGLSYKEICVLSLVECNREGTLFVNSSQRRRAEVTTLLWEYGIKEDDILCYERKDGEYYCYLDERCYLDELRDIFLRECGHAMQGFQEDLAVMKRVLQEEAIYQSWHSKYFMNEWILRG